MNKSDQPLAEFVRTLVGYMRVPCTVSVADATEAAPATVDIQVPEDARLLIGKDGQNLRALEHVIRMFWARRDSTARPVSVDINDYRKTRAAELVSSVHMTAKRVRDTRQPEALDPMTSYERRIVHTELAAYHDLGTESIGQEPHRRVVIKPL